MSNTFKGRDKVRCFWCAGSVPGSVNDTGGNSGHRRRCRLCKCGSSAFSSEQSPARWPTCERGTSPSSRWTSPPRTPPRSALPRTRTWAWSRRVDRFLRSGCTTGCARAARARRRPSSGRGRSGQAPPPTCRWPPGPPRHRAAKPGAHKHLSEDLLIKTNQQWGGCGCVCACTDCGGYLAAQGQLFHGAVWGPLREVHVERT